MTSPSATTSTQIGQDPPGAVDQAIHLIRQRGGRSTTPRRLVLETLMAAEGELRTAEDLLGEIQTTHPEFTESTVYRTLALLEDLELVDHVHLGHGPSHWYMTGQHRQWYLTCTACGKVFETDAYIFETLVQAVSDSTGFSIDSGHFAVTGICANCSTNADARSDPRRTSNKRTKVS